MFTPVELLAPLRAGAAADPWLSKTRQDMIDAAKPWLDRSDEDLWHLMFGPTLTRSWDVWSNGFCPSCKKSVVLYNWKIDGHKLPWKVTCPECRDVFPKNDFAAFYRSGLDPHNIFQYRLADRSLLFNVEHPDPADPLHLYAVDDGEGYLAPDSPSGQAEHRWRFIGAYLIYGQWKQLVWQGIVRLANAYAATGDARYAHKAGVLLDRVADLYPSFDHKTQAWVEEIFRTEGYVSTWHDACEETREMALAFDLCRDAIMRDGELAAFLQGKSQRHQLGRGKAMPADVCRNIEDGLLRDPLIHQERIHSNYPRREIATMVIHAALGWPANRPRVMEILDSVLTRATAVDGVTGEKGLAGYSAFVIQGLAVFLAQLERLEPGILRELMRRHPKLRQTYRFHIDTWVGQRFYPQVGDDGWFAAKRETYSGMGVTRTPGLYPSMFWFLWKLYEATGDPAYVQVLHHSNGGKLDELPYDLFHADKAGFQRGVAEVIARHGTELLQGSVLKPEWRLAILRSGRGAHERAIWLHFDSGGAHGHQDGLNVGLFAKGVDLMPDYGYPPLQISRAVGPHVAWYLHSAAHNTVVIDGKTQLSSGYRRFPIGGRCSLWAPRSLESGPISSISAVRVEAPEILCFDRLSEPVTMSGAGHDRIGLYSWTGMTCTRVRVWTKPEDAPDGDTGWTLAFEDAFDRGELGADWIALGDGAWRMAAGGGVTGKGSLMCTRSLPGRQRVEYEAFTDDPQPSDLSAVLSGGEDGHRWGAFFGFGTNDNVRSRLTLAGRDAASNDEVRIVVGKRHRILCERDGLHFRMVADGRPVLAMTNSAEALRRAFDQATGEQRFGRMLVSLDVSERDSYYLDLTRVRGGADHAKFMHSHFATLRVDGLSLTPAADFSPGTPLMRDFKTDAAARPGWAAEWRVIDRYGHLPPGADVRLRYTDLTAQAQASTCEGWICAGHFDQTEEAWIPRIMVRRRGDRPLESTFVGVIEPFEQQSSLAGVRRLPLRFDDGVPCGEGHVAVEVMLKDGRSDLIVAADERAMPMGALLEQPDWRLSTDAELCVVRRSAAGEVTSVLIGKGRTVRVGAVALELRSVTEHAELVRDGSRWRVTAGAADGAR